MNGGFVQLEEPHQQRQLMKSPHLQLVDLVVEGSAHGPSPVTVLGLQLLQLHPSFFFLCSTSCLAYPAQDSQLSGQFRILFLQCLLVLVQVGLGLAREAEGKKVLGPWLASV